MVVSPQKSLMFGVRYSPIAHAELIAKDNAKRDAALPLPFPCPLDRLEIRRQRVDTMPFSINIIDEMLTG